MVIARKVFVVLWMTVWPIVALWPTLTSGQVTDKTDAKVSQQPPATLSGGLLESPEVAATEVTEQLPSTEAATEELLPDLNAPSLNAPGEKLPAAISPKAPTHTASQATKPKKAAPPAVSPTLDTLPVQEQPSVTIESVQPSPRTARRIGTELADRDQEAQRLIHERALQRAQQRQARLEVKYRNASGIRPSTPSTRWYQQITHTQRPVSTRGTATP
jgi:hypothetical protein